MNSDQAFYNKYGVLKILIWIADIFYEYLRYLKHEKHDISFYTFTPEGIINVVYYKLLYLNKFLNLVIVNNNQ